MQLIGQIPLAVAIYAECIASANRSFLQDVPTNEREVVVACKPRLALTKKTLNLSFEGELLTHVPSWMVKTADTPRIKVWKHISH